MLRINKLCIRNYKSLEDVELSLGPLTVFVGPNNAGKSNILDALAFVRDLARIGAPAVHSRGGFSLLVWGGDLKRQVEMEFEVVEMQGEEGISQGTCRLAMVGGPVHYEVTELSPGQTQPVPKWDEPYQSWIARWGFYKLDPSRMAQPVAARRESRLGEKGENISALLHTLQAEMPEQFQELEGLLKSAIPELARLLTPLTEEGRTYLAWEEAGHELRIPTWAMSEGSLRLVGILGAVLAPEHPPLMGIEEPETCIHPGLLEWVVEVLRMASRRMQVLVTTHSPHLLNYLKPEEVVIVEKEEGKTRCSKVADHRGLQKALRVLGLGELWYSGELGGVP